MHVYDMTLAVKVVLNLNTTNQPEQQILDSSKVREFAEDNFEFDEIAQSSPKG